MNEPLRIAVIGAGDVGSRHLEIIAANPELRLVAIVDPLPKARDYARSHGVSYYEREFESMLDTEKPDGVLIATPTGMHYEMALACVARKIPALVEKPITDSIASALRLTRAAEQAGVALLVGHHRRYNAVLDCARSFIAGGGIGRLTAVIGCWIRQKPESYFETAWRREPGGGPLMINAIHDIDCLRMLCGEVEEVHAFVSSDVRKFAVEDTAAVLLRFKNGALGTFTISDVAQSPWAWELCAWENAEWYPQQPVHCYQLSGTMGSLTVPTLEHWRNETDGGRGDLMQRRRLHVVPTDPHAGQWRHFARVIRGEESPKVSAMEGTRTLATLLAINASAAGGASVKVEDYLCRDF
jgi:predicted dehydrogenase